MATAVSSANKHFAHYSQFIFIVALLLFAGYARMMFSYGHIQKELSVSENTAAYYASPAKQTLNTGVFSSKGWTYDFTKMPNGHLPNKDWNFANGPSTANYNTEKETYTPRLKNVRIEDGALVIEARKEKRSGKPYTSARIDTFKTFDFTYGELDVDMKLPRGAGTWPAAWLLPSQSKYKPGDYGIKSGDPYGWVLNGEIDFAESIGRHPGVNIPSAHSYNGIQRKPTITSIQVANADTEYHRYGIIKTPGKIVFTLDGQPYATRVRHSHSPLEWPYEQPYYLIIDLAIGGKWAGVGGIDGNSAPWYLSVRSISYKPLH